MNGKRVVTGGTRKVLNVSFTQGKKILKKNPRLTRFMRGILLDYINVEAAAITNSHYQQWILQNYPDAVELMHETEQLKTLSYKPLISILVPTYNTNLRYLTDCIESVRSQSYTNWELVLIDDASPEASVRELIQQFVAKDDRIHYIFRDKNGHISQATNDGLAAAKGEFIALLDHDDVIWPNALFENIKALNANRKLDFLYSNEDKITDNNWEHKDVFLKPDWNPEFLESVNYITHFSVLRKSLLKKIGGFRSKYDGAQDWDLFLRAGHATKQVHHIPKVLYSWRISATSAASGIEAKPYALAAQRHAIEDSLKNRGDKSAKVVEGINANFWNVEHPINGSPKVSIVIPTKNQLKVVKACVKSILKKTTYKNFEIILVDTGSTEKKVRDWYRLLTEAHKNIRVLDWPEQPFSYARACNHGVENAKGTYIALLNNDIEVVTPRWLEVLLGDAQREGIGAVGCKLYYPDSKHIQHAGIGVGLNGTAANLLSKVSKNNMTLIQQLYANTRHELSAVTAACLVIKKERFDEIGGFDEEFRVTYNDVDLCLKLRKAGYRNIYNPTAELIHHESISVGLPPELLESNARVQSVPKAKQQRDDSELVATTALLKGRWQAYIEHDPHIDDNIDRATAFMEPYVAPQDGQVY